jgi:uncharacterized protein (TIGR02147 family)
MQTTKPIFNYIDYRQFLRDYYEYQKEHFPYFSYRYFAQRAGIKNPVLLKMVSEGKRNLTIPMIEKFCTALKLNERQALFFKHLVLFNQAKSANEKQEHYFVLKSLANQVNQHVVGSDYFDYYHEWYTSVVRELVCHHDFKDDWEALAAAVQPPITPLKAKNAVALLLRVGLIRKADTDGRYELAHRAITTGPEISSLAVRSFNERMIELAGQSLEKFPLDQRYAGGVTMGITRECYDVLVSEIEAFKDRIVSIVNSFEQSERVYQMNLQLFPLSKEIRPEVKSDDHEG